MEYEARSHDRHNISTAGFSHAAFRPSWRRRAELTRVVRSEETPMMSVALLALGVSWQSAASIRISAERAVRELRPGADVEAAIDDNIRMPACKEGLVAQAKLSSGSTAMATVACTQRSNTWQLYVPVRLSEDVQVLVLNKPKGRGDVISSGDLRTETRSRASLAYGFFTETSAIQGQKLRRSLGIGAVLGPGDVEDAKSLRPGAPVTLISRSSGFEVRMNGRVLTTRSHGVVSAENLSSGRKISGRVIGPGLVEVTP